MDSVIKPRVTAKFTGSSEDQDEAAAFLGFALLLSLFLMAMILITQFNSFYHSALILFSVILSTVGVLLGLMITGQKFSFIMSGTGIVALAGIVVNNNIVLIDTFQRLRQSGMELHEAIVRTTAQRLRPILLTTITTIFGLLPMALGISVNFFSREVTLANPVSYWWTQMSTAVVWGLSFSTLLTLFLTPCLLMVPSHMKVFFKRQSWGRRRISANDAGPIGELPARPIVEQAAE